VRDRHPEAVVQQTAVGQSGEGVWNSRGTIATAATSAKPPKAVGRS
jgi:hypothetical protein